MGKKELQSKNKKFWKKVIDFIKYFFNSKQILFVALLLIIGGLLIFINHLMHATKTYMFNGSSDYVRILNGVAVIDDSLAIFEGSDIEYINESDVKVTSYTAGYYVKVRGEFTPVSIISDSNEEGVSLKKVLEDSVSFNVIESVSNDHYFGKDNVKALDRGLYFIIDATTKKGESIKDEITLDIKKMSK